MKKVFTLVEIMISLLILGILVVIVFRIFVTIGNILVRTENEKNIQNEILYLNQLFENLLDQYEIDYSKYSNLKTNKGITDILYLINPSTSETIAIYQTGKCNLGNRKDTYTKNCWLEINLSGNNFPLTDTGKVYVNNFIFKIIPFEKEPNQFSGIWQYGIGINGTFYIKRYNPNSWPMNVKINYTNFYDIKKR